MTPKEKAEKLVQKFIYRTKDYVEIEDAQKCALIAVEEMKSEINRFADKNYRLERMFYLDKVKEEIENL